MTAFFNFIKFFLPFAIILFAIQLLVTQQFFADILFYYSTWSIYLFQVILTLAAHSFLLFVHKNFPEKAGFTFMGMGVIKMMACVVFLIPLIQSETLSRIPDIAAFFIPYFMFLFFETIFAVRLINKL
ncbi:hypothetical protein [Flavobacterium sp.]|uniref:hypothetical protein n=1 Tax=Flavobacterium sp. TaxID=239 RepID=UPI0026149E97|nr:hypothetical protein [Flavobacterium sp.]MDD3004364.1 hypothetical protein [Flavobacterium sp.]